MNCPITAVMPTYNRAAKLLESLDRIFNCDPYPNQIIIHIDNHDRLTQQAIEHSKFADRAEIKLLLSSTQVGPGGGRNRAIAAAKNSIVASFDDDSYPIDSDYFARLLQLFQDFPEAAIIGAAIYHQHEPIQPDRHSAAWAADFVGCGCAYRREVFLQTEGYVPLPVAYGMEEIDLSLRLHDLNWKILYSPWLRVFHNTELKHHSSAKITAASIANQALLAYLRYPISHWGLGTAQCLNRIKWLIQHQRFRGIVTGVATVPNLIRQHQAQRQPISAQSLRSFLQLRRNLPQLFSLE